MKYFLSEHFRLEITCNYLSKCVCVIVLSSERSSQSSRENWLKQGSPSTRSAAGSGGENLPRGAEVLFPADSSLLVTGSHTQGEPRMHRDRGTESGPGEGSVQRGGCHTGGSRNHGPDSFACGGGECCRDSPSKLISSGNTTASSLGFTPHDGVRFVLLQVGPWLLYTRKAEHVQSPRGMWRSAFLVNITDPSEPGAHGLQEEEGGVGGRVQAL